MRALNGTWPCQFDAQKVLSKFADRYWTCVTEIAVPKYFVTLFFSGFGPLNVTFLQGTLLNANASNCRSIGLAVAVVFYRVLVVDCNLIC